MTERSQSAYDAAYQRYLRGDCTIQDVWDADPLDPALRRMAERHYEHWKRARDQEQEAEWQALKREWWAWLKPRLMVMSFAFLAPFVAVAVVTCLWMMGLIE